MRVVSGMLAGMVAALALTPPALAQDNPSSAQPPPLLIPVLRRPWAEPPYYVVQMDYESVVILSGGSADRYGDIAHLTMIFAAAEITGDYRIARFDSAIEFDCDKSLSRTTHVAAYDEDGNILTRQRWEDDSWEPVSPRSPNGTALAYACRGLVPSRGASFDTDLTEYLRAYRQQVIGG